MNTQADVLEEAPLTTATSVPATLSPMRVFGWTLRRELWDNPSLYLAPATVAGLILLGFFFSPFGLRTLSGAASIEVIRNGTPSVIPTAVAAYEIAAALISVTSLLVSVFYTVDALYAERRDRSILFWKSLPVSDLITVLAKASIPLLVLPLITFAITVVTHLVMLLASLPILLAHKDALAPFWSQLSLMHMWVELLGHLLVVAALWYAPFYAWLLLVSGAATRAPLLWAFLPPLALALVESLEFHTTVIGTALKDRLARGNLSPTLFHAAGTAEPDFGSASLWLGLLVAAVFLVGAIRMRRYRGAL